MAQNYTQMWDAFLGGEWAGGQEVTGDTDYLAQTREFYSNVIGPAFSLDHDFGSTDLEGTYAQFDYYDLETAERTFRSEIGDPYGEGGPFSWEKVSRYNTADFAGAGRIQDLLEDLLYDQGKFLGGQTGADYGTATAKELETYTSGLRGERESLTYEGLTGGAGIASGTGGSVLRSGESVAVAEDVLIEAYKKAKTLGSDYRAGSEEIEQTLSEDLDAALATYLDEIDEEKSRWFQDVLRNVDTFRTLNMGGETGGGLTDEELEERMPDYYNEWSCGYGQTWDGDKCVDTTGEGGYGEEVAGYQFREDDEGACGIGELWQDNGDGTGQCVLREDIALEEDDYGLLCAPDDIDECGICDGGNESCDEGCGPNEGPASYECPDGSMACGSTDCGEIDECGVSGGNGPAYLCPNGETVCAESDCTYETQPTNCPPGDPTCDPSGDMYCPDGYYLDETIMECIEEEPEEGDPGTGNVPVFCEDSESWTTGNSATDYTNCPDWDFDNTCADGSLPGDNIGYVCPEDQPDYCNCTQIGVTWDDKSGQLVPNFVLVCNEGNPNNGEPCEYGDGGDDNDGTGLPQLGG